MLFEELHALSTHLLITIVIIFCFRNINRKIKGLNGILSSTYFVVHLFFAVPRELRKNEELRNLGKIFYNLESFFIKLKAVSKRVDVERFGEFKVMLEDHFHDTLMIHFEFFWLFVGKNLD